jgi:hypothetical protein
MFTPGLKNTIQQATAVSLCGHGSEPSPCTKDEEFAGLHKCGVKVIPE